MIDFHQQIAALSLEQQALFEKRLKQRSLSYLKVQEISVTEIPKRKDSNRLPLSFPQQHLWCIQQLDPNNTAYNLSNALRIKGQVDVAVLEQALTEVFRRHEILRTTFVTTVEGQPIQAIGSPQPLTLPVVDLRGILEKKQEVQRLANIEAQQAFNLAQEPLLRLILLRVGKAEHVLLLTIHHIISDRWSMGVFTQELSLLYEAFFSNKPSPLPELPIQYADFAIWQRHWLLGKVAEAQLDYWRQQLGGNLPILELPTDRPRPTVRTFRGARKEVMLPKSLSDAIKALSIKQGVTLYVMLLAAFQTLLYRYTGKDDIIVGTDIASRNQIETQGLIGFLINILVLRTYLGGNPTFCELLKRVREVVLKAYAYRDFPFEKLVEVLNPERSLSHTPLFQIKLDLQQAPVLQMEIPGLTISSLPIDNWTARFELRLNLEDTEQGLQGCVEYNTDLFNAVTITRIIEHFRTLLEGVVTNPEQPLSDLLLLTAVQGQPLLMEWNSTQTDYPKDQPIHQMPGCQTLPAPNGLWTQSQATDLVPYTEIEQTITTIWQEVLDVEKVGINDNFFVLGGHSLLIIQVHSKLQGIFNRDVSTADLFKYQTIKSLANYLGEPIPLIK